MCASHLLNRWLHGVSNTGEQEMVQVSLEQIQPFSLNPRVTRNPGYDVLKASILARGLDNPPVLTRRPGDEKYMLASGGNTRLAILNELWQETQDERYHRVCWPFRPWPETLSPQQGEVQCLIGHLAESDLHNGLMFIERAEGVLHLRALYLEAGIECPTQLALAEQLTRDGYPVSQSQISRMLQTVDWLLPCIPNALYGGLTRVYRATGCMDAGAPAGTGGMSEQRAPPSPPPQGPIGWLLSLAGRIIGLVIGALVLRVVLELVGLYFWWPQEGSRHAFQVMRQEQAELVSALQPHPLRNEMVMLLENGTTHGLLANRFLQKPFTALAYTLVSFMQRLVWLVSILPLVCLCVLIGLTDGLVRRDLRRFGSGLESVFLHRYVIRSGSSVATTLWVFYLAQPLFLPAMLVLLPAALWFGITVWMVAGSFKRWL